MMFVRPPVVCVELVVKASEIMFQPPLSELEAMVHRLVSAIVEGGQGLPRVEHVLFPDLQGLEMLIPSVQLGERVVVTARERALQLLRMNLTGPQRLVLPPSGLPQETDTPLINCRYLSSTYEKYHSFLDGTASQEVDAFLKSEQELSTFGKVSRELITMLSAAHTVHPPSLPAC